MTRWIFVAKSSAMQFKFDFAKYSPESLRLHYAKKHLSFSVLHLISQDKISQYLESTLHLIHKNKLKYLNLILIRLVDLYSSCDRPATYSLLEHVVEGSREFPLLPKAHFGG